MKFALGSIVGALAGSICMYLYMGNAFGAANQMSYEITLSNDLRSIEVLEEHGGDALRESLKTRLGCAKSSYDESLDSFFWKRTRYSSELLQKLEEYSHEARCALSEGNA